MSSMKITSLVSVLAGLYCCLLTCMRSTYFDLWLHRMSPLESPGRTSKQQIQGEERRGDVVEKKKYKWKLFKTSKIKYVHLFPLSH